MTRLFFTSKIYCVNMYYSNGRYTDKVVEYQRSFGNLLRGVYYNVKEILTMSKKIHTEAVDSLFDAILSLKNREECLFVF